MAPPEDPVSQEQIDLFNLTGPNGLSPAESKVFISAVHREQAKPDQVVLREALRAGVLLKNNDRSNKGTTNSHSHRPGLTTIMAEARHLH